MVFGSSSSKNFEQSSIRHFGQRGSNQSGNSLFASQPDGSSPFYQKPPFGRYSGCFGQTQSLSGSNTLGPSVGCGPSSQSAFGTSTSSAAATTSSVFGVSSTPPSTYHGTWTMDNASSASGTSLSGSYGNPTFSASCTPASVGFRPPGQFASGTNTTISTATTPFALGVSSIPPPTFCDTASSASGSYLLGSFSNPAFSTSSSLASVGFGPSSQFAFGTSTPSATATTTSAFGVSSVPLPAFHGTGSVDTASSASDSCLFGSFSNPTFSASSTSASSFGFIPCFGRTAAEFGSGSSSGVTPSPFGSHSSWGYHARTPTLGNSSFRQLGLGGQCGSQIASYTTAEVVGDHTTMPASVVPCFGQSAFGGQHGGSRWASYTTTDDEVGERLLSICAMPAYAAKMNEELRWEDYQLGVRGSSAAQAATRQSSISALPVYNEKSYEELQWEDYLLGDKGGPRDVWQSIGSSIVPSNPFVPAHYSSPFNTSSSSSVNPFGPSISSAPSTFATVSPAQPNNFAVHFPSVSSSALSIPILHSSTALEISPSAPLNPFIPSAQYSSPFNALSSTNPFSPHFSSTPPTFATVSPVPPNNFTSAASSIPMFHSSSAMEITPTASETYQPFAPSHALQDTSSHSSLVQPNKSDATLPTTHIGTNLFSPLLFQSTQTENETPCRISGQFLAVSSCSGGITKASGQISTGEQFVSQSNLAVLQSPVTSPFQTRCGDGGGSATPVQYGISSMPLRHKPAPVRDSSLIIRHFSERPRRKPLQKFDLKSNCPKVPFFCNEEGTPDIPRAANLIIPRDKPGALLRRSHCLSYSPTVKECSDCTNLGL